MKVSDFDYPLAKELIAQEPLANRDDARMMVLVRGGQRVVHSHFRQLGDYLAAGDCLVLNDTKVIPARLHGRRAKTGGRVEVLLLEPAEGQCSTETPNSQLSTLNSDVFWLALTNSRSPLGKGETVHIADGMVQAQVEAISEDGTRLVRFNCAPEDFRRMLQACGKAPLPPYIRRPPQPQDAQRYQTVYARSEGAVAAPTAGLHFTPEMLDTLQRKGVNLTTLTLHIGLGTFRPVKAENVEEHRMHSERFELPPECAEAVSEARSQGKHVIAVGTTVARVLEACADEEGHLTPQTGRTDLFIYPGYRFKVVDALLTNFHLPRSTLLMLVCAFAGTDFVLEAYRQAVAAKYRFYSYGDCMLLLA